ncbi:MAG: sensor histidine kinase [Saprospiraceae bacterium]|nr:sensor histidine kinase [Saprospiraceae bacterium]
MGRTLLILLFLSGLHSFAQDTTAIDSLKALLNTPDRHDTLKIFDELTIAKNYYFINRDSSKYYNELARDYSKNVRFQRGLARAQTNLALLLINENKADEAEELLNEALSILTAIKDPETELFIYSNLGILNHYDTDYQVAVDYYLTTADIARSINNTYEEARAYLNIGDVFNQNKLSNKAVEYLAKTREISEADYPILFVYSAAQLADIFRENNSLDSAWAQINGAFDQIGRIVSPQILSQAYSVRANIWEAEENYVVAYPDYLQSLSYAEQLGQDYAIAGCYCLLGNNAHNRDEYSEAETYFEKYAGLSQKVNNKYLDRDCLMYWSLMEEARGNYKKSNELLYRNFAIKDSIYSEENRILLTGLETKYQSAQKDAEIATQNLRINRRTTQRNWFVAGAGGLLLFSWFFYYRNRKNKTLSTAKIENLEKQQKLMAMDYMVQGQEEERKRIAQDLHDGLGGLLSSARIQMQKIQGEIENFANMNLFNQAEKLIDNAHIEVRRIAHDMMPGALIDLGLMDAVEDLVDKTRKEHNIIVNLSKPSADLHITEPQSVNLYRTIQEILTNTIKHGEAGIVDISLQVKNQKLILNISDDGKGFDYAEAKKRDTLGLTSIESRVKYMGGELQVQTDEGKGTGYQIQIPIPSE